MSKSEDFDQERRREKARFNWAKALLKPQTFKALVALGKLIAQVLCLILEIIKAWRG
jgi:hypothetical protein